MLQGLSVADVEFPQRSESLYYVSMTAHGVLMALVFTTFFIMGLGYVFSQESLGRTTGRPLAWIAFWIAIAGSVTRVLTEVAAAGGVILFISALAVVVVILATWFRGKRITPPAFEFAVPLQRPTTMGVWDRFGLWTVVAILPVVAAYAYPLIQLLAHPRFGSPAFRPF